MLLYYVTGGVTLMSHDRFTIMQNDVFTSHFSSKCDADVSQRHGRHRTVHVDFYVHARGTCTTATQPPPRLLVAVGVPSSPAIIFHESATATRPMPITSDVYVDAKPPPASLRPQSPRILGSSSHNLPRRTSSARCPTRSRGQPMPAPLSSTACLNVQRSRKTC